jgi:hypothetical protein
VLQVVGLALCVTGASVLVAVGLYAAAPLILARRLADLRKRAPALSPPPSAAWLIPQSDPEVPELTDEVEAVRAALEEVPGQMAAVRAGENGARRNGLSRRAA